jgi:hypothetical protein
MSVGALIGAYQEDDSGGLRALLPLAGRTLLEYQARCAAAAGAAPIVVLAERVPAAFNDALERLRGDGIAVVAVSDGNEAAMRFEAGALVLLVGDGVAPSVDLLASCVEQAEPTVATVPDDEAHAQFERIDAHSRWAGVALVEGMAVGATAAMLGDWDLQSTLLRKTLQAGARRQAVPQGQEPLLADRPEELAGFERRLVVASRGARRDWASRYVLPIIEDFATERLMDSRVRPQWLMATALVLTIAAAFCFTRGWLAAAMAMLVATTPLDLIARRLGTLRLRPLAPHALSRRMLWPLAGLALLALGWRLTWHGTGWGALATAMAAAAFAEAARIERGSSDLPGSIWLFSRRNAILAALPFAIFGAWTTSLAALAIYAAGSFFFAQHVHHRIGAIDDALTRA